VVHPEVFTSGEAFTNPESLVSLPISRQFQKRLSKLTWNQLAIAIVERLDSTPHAEDVHSGGLSEELPESGERADGESDGGHGEQRSMQGSMQDRCSMLSE
jgi:hypothetical protein